MVVSVLSASVGAGLLESVAGMSTLAIIFFCLGILLLIGEMFAPNFGIMGGVGLLSLFVSVLLTARNFLEGLILSLIILAGAGIFLTLVLRSAYKGRLSKKLILRDSTDTSSGYVAVPRYDALLGKSGTALTVLRPAGTALLGGVRVDVVSNGEFIAEGKPVTVVQVVGSRVVVEQKSDVPSAAGV